MIELSDVGMSYGGDTLLDGIDLSLAPGAFYFLTGPSGAGKTTLLRLSYLDLLPTAGAVTVFGQAARDMTRDEVARMRRRIGVVDQETRFIDHLPLRENVALPLVVAGRDPAAEAANLDELLAWVGLSRLVEATPPQLSGGERQRAALARAVILSPEVIIADEPTGNVDWEMSLRIMTLLVELNRMGKTILIATHDLALIRQVKTQVQARVLRIRGQGLEVAGADL